MGANDRKSGKGRLVVTGIYLTLAIGGLAMVYPFMLMVTGSLSTAYDVDRRSATPRFLWSREDRFMRMLCEFFPASHRASMAQVRSSFKDFPGDWRTWTQIGDEVAASDRWAGNQIAAVEDERAWPSMVAAAEDYHQFAAAWDLKETVLAYNVRNVRPFLEGKYRTLSAYNAAWGTTLDDFSRVSADEWSGEPIDQAGYVPPTDTRYKDLLEFRQAYRDHRFESHFGTEAAPASPLRPAALAYLWEAEAAKVLGKTQAEDLVSLPFPVPDDAAPELRAAWRVFLAQRFPLRHVAIHVTPERSGQFRTFLVQRFRNLGYLNQLMAARLGDWIPLKSWDDVAFTSTASESILGEAWIDFVRTSVPQDEWTIRDTLPEKAFQAFALRRHGDLAGVNKAYGLRLERIEQLRIPLREALLVTFHNTEWTLTSRQVFSTYGLVFDYLFLRGRAVGNTAILVFLTILISVTVNPLAGYALSRFRMRQTQKVIVFCLATTAFPDAVAAIPGFLLLRDLDLLNTFSALILPTAANGMTIFLLKGFFDSLPQELYEAATIDGANEVQVFWRISLPLVKPILAVGVLNAFIQAYNGWAWAILVCQDQGMWTLAVWTYQFYQTMGSAPHAVMAAFLINSIPVFIVFLLCQKIILRGIILPTMK